MAGMLQEEHPFIKMYKIFLKIGRAECVRCPWLLAQTKVATILGILVWAECMRQLNIVAIKLSTLQYNVPQCTFDSDLYFVNLQF